jgi:WD40 repeat protein
VSEIFLSYSRRDADFVRRIFDGLQQVGRSAWVDWAGIPPSAEWMKEIHAAIEAAEAVVAVVSPHFVRSTVCLQEVLHAAANNKRIVPIVREDVDLALVPKPVADRQWIYFRDQDDFERAFALLQTALDSNLDWIKRHTRLLTRAIEWQTRNYDHAYALHGSDLRQSEHDLLLADKMEPPLTSLQIQYIVQSRRNTNRRRNIGLGVAGAAATVLIVVGLLFWQKRHESELNLARDFREQASTELADGDPSASELYFARSLTINDELVTRQLLLQARSKAPRLLWVDPQSLGSSLLAFSPDGAWFLTQTKAALEIRELATRATMESLPAPAEEFRVAAFSNNGRFLAASDGALVTVWPIGSPAAAPIATIKDTEPPESLAISPSGDFVVCGGTDGSMSLWDLRAQPARRIGDVHSHTDAIASLAFSHDGRFLASGSIDNSAKLWAISDDQEHPSLQELRTLVAHDDAVGIVAFSPNDEVLATGGWDSQVWLWDARNGERLRQLAGHEGVVSSLAFSANGELIASGSEDRTARVWDVATGRLQLVFPGAESAVSPVTFARAANANELAMADAAGTIRLWDLDAVGQREELATLKGHQLAVTSLSFNPQRNQLASSSRDRSIQLWDLNTKGARALIAQNDPGHSAPVTAVRFSPDGKRLVSASKDGTARLWDVESGAFRILPQGEASPPRVVRDVAFSPDGKLVASASDDGRIRIWTAADGLLSNDFPMDRDSSAPLKALSVAFSPDGQVLATSNEAGEIKIWRTADWSNLHILSGHEQNVWQLAFSGDSKLLVSVGDDRTARVWDVATGHQIGSPLLHDGELWTVAVAPDSRTFATGGSDSTVHIWPLRADGNAEIAPVLTLRLSDGPIWALAFSLKAGQTLLAMAGPDRDIRVVNITRLGSLFDDPEKLEREANVESGLEIAAGPDFRIRAAQFGRH